MDETAVFVKSDGDLAFDSVDVAMSVLEETEWTKGWRC